MNTILLRYAVEVGKAGSITQAANNLYMDQPNLSKAIKTLEESLGAPIFKRTPKGVIPTPKGTLFLERARTVLAQIEQMEALYKPPGEETQISLSAPRAEYAALAFQWLFNSQRDAKRVKARFKETSAPETIRDVSEGEYGVGIISYPESYERQYLQMAAECGLTWDVMWEYRQTALMSPAHPLAGERQITKHMLRPYVKIVYGDEPPPWDHLHDREARERGAGSQVKVFDRASAQGLLAHMDSAYMLAAPAPQDVLSARGLVQIPFAGQEQERHRAACIYLKHTPALRQAKELAGSLESFFCALEPELH